MEKLLKFLGGWVRLRLFSREPERFLNLCAGKKILLWDLRRRDGCYEFSLSLKDFFRLRPAARKSGSRIRILGRRGMPFFFRKCRRRKAFFAGVFLCFLLMFLLSCRIWNIHVEGNYANSTGDILSFLDSIGVSHGIRRSRIDCAETASAVREAFPNVTWVSVRIRGTRLLVDIKENVDGYRESREDSPEGAWDLAAEKSGVVDSIITRQGVPLVEAGESCEAGDILVSGQIPIKSDSGEILRWEPVEARRGRHAPLDAVLLSGIPAELYQPGIRGKAGNISFSGDRRLAAGSVPGSADRLRLPVGGTSGVPDRKFCPAHPVRYCDRPAFYRSKKNLLGRGGRGSGGEKAGRIYGKFREIRGRNPGESC